MQDEKRSEAPSSPWERAENALVRTRAARKWSAQYCEADVLRDVVNSFAGHSNASMLMIAAPDLDRRWIANPGFAAARRPAPLSPSKRHRVEASPPPSTGPKPRLCNSRLPELPNAKKITLTTPQLSSRTLPVGLARKVEPSAELKALRGPTPSKPLQPLRAGAMAAVACGRLGSKLSQLEFVDRTHLNTLSSMGLAQLREHWSTHKTEEGVVRSSQADALLPAVCALRPLADALRKRGGHGSLTGLAYVPQESSYELKSEHFCSVDLGANYARVTKGSSPQSRPRLVSNAIVFEFSPPTPEDAENCCLPENSSAPSCA